MRKSVLICACLLSSLAKAYDPPIMGWSSWNTYRVHISDSLIMRQADAMVASGLHEVGYTYVNIDDGYFGGRDAEGRLTMHPTRFPNGLKGVVEHIHRLGLKAGIYSDAGSNTCGSFWDKDPNGFGVGMYGHEAQDADLFFNELGFDFIKVDFCGGNELQLNERQQYTAIHEAIRQTGRDDVRLNVCRWNYPGTWVCEVASSWRISQDIGNNWASVTDIIGQNLYLSAFAGEGHYNDMDMLEIGRGLSEEEERTHFGMWCIMSSPLLIGCDLTTIDPKSLALLKNTELIAVNQDPLGLQAHVVKKVGGTYILVKDVEAYGGTTRVVAFYNPTDAVATMSIALADVELGGSARVRDLIHRRHLPPCEDTLTAEVPAHGTRIYRLEGEKRLERTLYEAETAWLGEYQELSNSLAMGTATFTPAINCSGEMMVSGLGGRESNDLQWRNIYSRRGGFYTMQIGLVGDEGESCCVSVNGRLISNDAALPCDSGETGTVSMRVKLRKGLNTIRLHNAAGPMPDVDYMKLQPLSLRAR